MPKLTHLMSNKTVIARRVTVSGIRSAYSTVTSEFGHLQPINRSQTEVVDGVFGQVFRFYFEGDVDIQEGDRLRDEQNNYYTVLAGGVQRRTFGSIDFIQADVQKTT